MPEVADCIQEDQKKSLHPEDKLAVYCPEEQPNISYNHWSLAIIKCFGSHIILTASIY